ncbi:SAV_2336 family protein [Kitasatospora sp. NBC_00374]|uniref:SAV_2336 N-terminal domain-related protein n=1 Tax=Kitasatospora sp. NBC_00374 TaxID=2975964 RepID=UPI003255108F
MTDPLADPLAQLVRALDRLPGDTDATTIAEILWLAAHSEGPDPGKETTSSNERFEEDEAADSPAPQRTSPSAGRHAEASANLYERPPAQLPTRPVSVPRAQALPRSLEVARALRPLKRRWRAGTLTDLDIDATVDGFARSGELLPVFTPKPERWFETLLIVDRSPSMTVWQETAAELRALLSGLGAFRRLRSLTLSFDGPTAELCDHQGRPADRPSAVDGRTLILVLSDCTDPGWRAPGVWQLLRRWAETTPTALVNPLPTKLWPLTGLDLPAVRAKAATPGARNTALAFELPLLLRMRPSDGGSWIPVPVVSLVPYSFDRWARTMMRGDPDGCEAVLVPEQGRLPVPPRPVRSAGVDPVGAFLRTASPNAVRLAVLCAAFQRLSLPLLHLIRQTLVPEGNVGDVAEFLNSKLLVTEEDEREICFSFHHEARRQLASRLIRNDVWRINAALSRYVASHASTASTFEAALCDDSIPELPEDLQPFARASMDTLRLLGVDTARPRVEADIPAAGALRSLASGRAGAALSGGAHELPHPVPAPTARDAKSSTHSPYITVVTSALSFELTVARVDEQLDAWLKLEGYDLPPTSREAGPARYRLANRVHLDRDSGELSGGDGRYMRRRLRTPAPAGTHQLTLVVAGSTRGPVWVRIESEHLATVQGGRSPARPPVPELVRTLLPVLGATDGTAEVHVTPRVVTVDEVNRVIAELCDPARRLPVVVASVPPGAALADWLDAVVRPLMRQLAGLAVLYVLDPPAQRVFNTSLEYHKVYGGAVRTYLRAVDPASRQDGLEHPVLPRHRIEEDVRRAAALLAREPRHRAAIRPLPDVLAEVPVLRVRIGEERQESDSPNGAPDDEQQRRADELSRLRAGLRRSRRREQSLLAETAGQSEALRRVSAQVRVLTGRLHLAAGLQSSDPADGVAGSRAGSDTEPASFAELLGRLSEFPLLEFTGDQKEALALDGQVPGNGWARLTWDGLTSLQEYAEAAVRGEAPGDFKQWCEHTPPGCQPFPPRKAVRGESRTVESHSKWKRERMLPVPESVDSSRRAFMGAHLRIGAGRTAPRLHYLDDCSGSGRIYIGYIGLHLTNTRTN